MNQQTWYCADCGGREIHRDAAVKWNPANQEYDVVTVHDGTTCTTCAGAPDNFKPYAGSPVFGIPPEPADTVKVQLALTVEYTPNGCSTESLVELLSGVASSAAMAGQLTGESPAEVAEWTSRVAVLQAQ